MNFKSVIILSLTFLLVVSCQEKKDKIEIYLLNKRIISSEGVPFTEMSFYDSISEMNKENYKFCSFNLKDSSKICAGKFEVKTSDINEKPLVEDDEIISLNLKNNQLALNEKGDEKVKRIKPDNIKGTQFVICVNKKPVLTGYFKSNFSSFYPSWNFIYYSYENHDDLNYGKQINLKYTLEKCENRDFKLLNLEEYPELIQAFKNTNRLLEE